MREIEEFHYRLPGRVRGHRPGSHPGLVIGAGQEFVSHVRLYDRPDPRRLDLRASLRSLTGDWLVRVSRQRSGMAVHALVDVSASMTFGVTPKLHVAADFLESLGVSAFRTGDALGLLAFDSVERTELFMPARLGRGMGSVMATNLRTFKPAMDGAAPGCGARGLQAVAQRIAGRQGLVFIVSDFLWPLEQLGACLDLLTRAFVVPLVIWNSAEIEPPAADGIAWLRDAESGARRAVWLRPRLRSRWREAMAQRRQQLDRVFASRFIRPVYVRDEFSAEALSRYFLEGAA